MKKVLLTITTLGLFVLPAYATQGIREQSKNEIARIKKNSIEKTQTDSSVKINSPDKIRGGLQHDR